MPNEERRDRPPQPPRPPVPTQGMQRQRAEYEAYKEDREAMERRSLIRGLVVVALVLLLAGFARAGLERVFVSGWWKQW